LGQGWEELGEGIEPSSFLALQTKAFTSWLPQLSLNTVAKSAELISNFRRPSNAGYSSLDGDRNEPKRMIFKIVLAIMVPIFGDF
jgi:hypothetical protein